MQSAGGKLEKVVSSVTWLLLALVALGGGALTASELRGALEREREFRAASACTSVPVEASGCLWEQEFTVRNADMHHGERGEPPAAELLLPSGEPWDVTFRNTDPVASEMAPDDTVVGLIWHGQVVEVRDADGRRQQTSVGPVGWPEDRLGGALACTSFGLTALVGSIWPLFARGNRRHARAAALVRWHGVGMGGAALLTLWTQSAAGWPMWTIPAIWGSLALLLVASMAAFASAALRGSFDDEEARAVTGPPDGAGSDR